MVIFYETENFTVEAMDKPHLDRDEGGHIRIKPKVRVRDRQTLAPKLAIELMRLTVVVGKAMEKVMNANGVDVGRLNYQDNGNWGVFSKDGPYLHVHLYGRAKSAKIQKYGHACVFPTIVEDPKYYAKCKPLNEKDVKDMKSEVKRLMRQRKYSDVEWGLK